MTRGILGNKDIRKTNASRCMLGIVVLCAISSVPYRQSLCRGQQTPSETASETPASPGEAAEDGEALTDGPVEVDPQARDDEIAQRLSEILESTEWFQSPEVGVENGVVFLRGRSERAQYKDWATQLATKTLGVAAVVNRIELVDGPVWDFAPAYAQLKVLWRSAVQSLPLIVVGVVILMLTYVATRVASHLARRALQRRMENQLLRGVAAKAVAIPVFIVGLYVVLHVAGLTRLALTVLGGTGLAGLVIGIAFRDIAENFLASLLISIQTPFRAGDLIKVQEHLGFVQKVTTRGTLLMAFDGTYIQIPNATIYKNVILNYTANSRSRLDFSVGIGYDEPIAKAQEIARNALADHPAILDDPQPMVLVESLGAATVNLRVYFWIDSQAHSNPRVISAVIRLVKAAYMRAGMSLPDESREVVFPSGVPVRMLDDEVETATPVGSSSATDSRYEEESESVATPAEGELVSETEQMRTQAEASRQPEEGHNLLTDEEVTHES